MARSTLRFQLFRGPGEVEALQAAVVGRQWSVLVNSSGLEADARGASAGGALNKKHIHSVGLSPFTPEGPSSEEEWEPRTGKPDLRVVTLADEARPGRRSCIIESRNVAIAMAPAAPLPEPPIGHDRVVVLDASWTHIARFPDREEVAGALEAALRQPADRVYYITNLHWDAEIFAEVAREQGQADRTQTVIARGFGERMHAEVRSLALSIKPRDLVLLALAPGRDDRGALQRLRSNFAAQTEHVQAYPAAPICSGPGPSREEASETVGLWLPARVLIAGGPMSEQVLLARYLSEQTGGVEAVVGLPGAEYRLPSLDVTRVQDHGRPITAMDNRRQTPRNGLVIVTGGREDIARLAGAGLSEDASKLLNKLRINRRGKPPERVAREVEVAFSSRGLPAPAVRIVS